MLLLLSMRKSGENVFFLIVVLCIFMVGVIAFVKTPTEKSTAENRVLEKFEHFTVAGFIDGSFQDNFENALSDQFLLSEKIRVNYSRVINKLPSPDISSAICANHYVEFANSVDFRRATYNCEDYIVFYPEALTEQQMNNFSENIKKYNRLNNITDTYYYFINDSFANNYETGGKTVDYVATLKDELSGKYHFAGLDSNTYDKFKELFYKTDHHWDYRGSYQGYLDIVKMLGIKDPLTPVSTGTNHEYAFGSHARTTKDYSIKEEFTYYNFDVAPYDTMIDGKPGRYGNQEDYKNHNYEYNKTTNYYAYYYGDDYGEVIFDFHQPNKENLLIISNSFSNAVNELIASHFNKTYVIDLRHYKETFGKDFDIQSYTTEHEIDKTLLIMSPTFVTKIETNQGLES